MCKAIEIYGEERRIEGETKRAIENAKKMIADNLPIEKIAEYSGLPLAKVKELAETKTA